MAPFYGQSGPYTPEVEFAFKRGVIVVSGSPTNPDEPQIRHLPKAVLWNLARPLAANLSDVRCVIGMHLPAKGTAKRLTSGLVGAQHLDRVDSNSPDHCRQRC
jgi:hypothetical protein